MEMRQLMPNPPAESPVATRLKSCAATAVAIGILRHQQDHTLNQSNQGAYA
jgi:hypothetical protein